MRPFLFVFDNLANPKQRAFLAAYIIKARIAAAARIAGVDRGAHYEWLRTDKAYAEAFGQAEKMAGDVAEDEAKRRAIKGILEPVIHRGYVVEVALKDQDGKPVLDAEGKEKRVPLMKRKYSDRLLALILQGAKPEKYGKKLELGGEVTLNLADRLAAGRARVQKTPSSD